MVEIATYKRILVPSREGEPEVVVPLHVRSEMESGEVEPVVAALVDQHLT